MHSCAHPLQLSLCSGAGGGGWESLETFIGIFRLALDGDIKPKLTFSNVWKSRIDFPRRRKQKLVPQNSPVMHCQCCYTQASCPTSEWLIDLLYFIRSSLRAWLERQLHKQVGS